MSIETVKRPEVVSGRRKLLVFNVSGFLLDSYRSGKRRPRRRYDAGLLSNKLFVYDRPFCHEFLQFCFDNFVVGVWSSHQRHNVQAYVSHVFKETTHKLAFVWHQDHCTDTGFSHPDNGCKPVFLKELRKLWRNEEPGLPWKAGDYGPSNTLLIDDSPSKAIKNPPHTAIFPKTYDAANSEDDYLGKELRIYLEGLLETADVQAYVLENPIGEPSITAGDPRWSRIFLSLNPENENGRSRFISADVVSTGLEPKTSLANGDEKPEKSLSGEDENGKALDSLGNKDEEFAKKLSREDESKSNGKEPAGCLGSLGSKDEEVAKKLRGEDDSSANGKGIGSSLGSLGNEEESEPPQNLTREEDPEEDTKLDGMLRKLHLQEDEDTGEDVPVKCGQQ